MAKFTNEVGNKYGRLTVLAFAGYNKWAKPQPIWRCVCECGNEVIVPGSALRSGNTKSCGCLQIEKRKESNCLPKGLASFHRLYREYEKSAERKNRIFELTEEQFESVTRGNCHYCGMKPKQIRHDSKFCNGVYIFNGIDRIDNNKGYTMNNVVTCCKLCNYMKRSMEVSEFMKHIERIYNHRRKS